MAKQTYEALFLLSGQLAGSFGATFKGAAKHFESLKTGAAGFSGAVTGALGKVGSALTSIPAQIAGLGAGAGFVAMGAHAINLAADMEKLGTAMTVHLGSASKAQALIGQIQQFATETPFEFKELATAGKQLLAFGFAGDQVVTNLKMLGDVASGLSMPIGDLVYLFGTLKAQGRAFQGDINQFTNRGIPIYDALTKSIKETAKAQGELTIKVGEGKKAMKVPVEQFDTKHIRTMVEAGQIGFKQIEAAFQQLTGAGGKFFGMIEAQSQTFGGRLSTMKDNVNNLFLQIGQPITDTISPFLAELNASPVWTQMAEGITNTLVPAVQGLIVALKSGLGQTISTLGKDFMGLVGSIGTETSKLFGAKPQGPTLPMQPKAEAPKSVYGQLSKMKMPATPKMGMAPVAGAEQYKSITGELTRLAEVPPPDMTWIKTAEGMVKQLSEAFKWLAENMDKVVLAVKILGAAFAAAQLVGLIAAIANPIGLVVIAVAALTAGLAYLVTNWDKVTAAMNEAWGAVQQWAAAEWTAITDDIGKIGAKAKETWDTLKAVPVIGDFFKVAEQNFAVSMEAIKAAWLGVKTFFESTPLGQVIAAHFQGLGTQISAALSGIGEWLMLAFTNPIAAIKAAWDGFIAYFQGIGPQISAGLAGVSEALTSAFMNPINTIKAAWDALVNAIKSFNPAEVLGNIGRAITGQKAQTAAMQTGGGAGGGTGTTGGWARGGVVNSPKLGWVGEAGPEAVIPLSGDRSRNQGLLSAAADRIGMGGAGGSIVNFQPNVTINGAPNQELATTLDKKLRELSRDFMAEWQQAHRQERRLAFG